MSKILISVDALAPTRTAAALDEALRLHAKEPVDVHLLNVQPRLSGHASMCFGHGRLRDLQQAAGEEDLAEAQAVLARSAVPFTSSVRFGRSAETIVATARELGCDRILLEQGASAGVLAGMLVGSLVQQVRQLASVGGGCEVIAV